MPRGRKPKVPRPSDLIVQQPKATIKQTVKAKEIVQTIIDSGEYDIHENKVYDTPLLVDPEVAIGFTSLSQNVKDAILEERVKQDFTDWDVKINDKIEYFDPTLSYELTGYRPVDEVRGLDFDPTWFTPSKDTKLRTGKYCTDSGKRYTDFWKEEFRRCNNGYISHGYRITGDNYFFLNYYRLKDVADVEVAGKGRITGFPSFYSKQYEYFHYIDVCEHLKKDIIALKSRGVETCPPNTYKRLGN